MKAITVSGLASTVSVVIAPDAFLLREEAIGTALLVGAVTTPAQQENAVVALRMIKTIKKGIEDSRVAIKAPILTLGKDIDHAAKTFCAQLDSEEARITRMVSAYQAEQQRIAREAEEKRQAELRRIESERLAAEREAKRIADEQMAAAKTLDAAQSAAVAEQERVEKAQADAVQAQAAALAVPIIAPARADGMQVRSVPKFEILDIRALAFARPDLVRIEPNSNAINAAIRGGNLNITGLKCWMETQAGVRV